MNEFYYLISSLPYLTFGDEPPVTVEWFMAECRKWLSPGEMKVLLSADVRRHEIMPEDIELVKSWKKFDMELREELAGVRMDRKFGGGQKAPERLKEVMEQETPLLMEQKLEKIRWDFIEGKTTGHYFDIEALVMYFLKLQILQRLATFDKDEGEKTFYQLCEVHYE